MLCVISDQYQYSPYDKQGRSKHRHVIVSYSPKKPYIMDVGANLAGSDVEVVRSISSRLSVTAEFGQQSYSGLTRSLVDKSADMSVCQVSIVVQRYQLGLDFAVLIFRKVGLVQRHPVPKTSAYTMMCPFELNVWLTILLATILVGITLGAISRQFLP